MRWRILFLLPSLKRHVTFLTKIPFMNEVIKLCIIISVKVQVFEEKNKL